MDMQVEEPSYVVYIRGEPFHLSQSQIQFDSPNYFTMAFSDSWTEGTTRELRLTDRDSELFRACESRQLNFILLNPLLGKYVFNWLAGYTLPWDEIKRNKSLCCNLYASFRASNMLLFHLICGSLCQRDAQFYALTEFERRLSTCPDDDETDVSDWEAEHTVHQGKGSRNGETVVGSLTIKIRNQPIEIGGRPSMLPTQPY
jgi:hypothetical protein